MARDYKARAWKQNRPLALERDNYQCMRCGVFGKYQAKSKVNSGRLAVHHIDRDGSDELSNLITLCLGCHDEYTSSHQMYGSLDGQIVKEQTSLVRWLSKPVPPHKEQYATFELQHDLAWAEEVQISAYWGSWPEWADHLRNLFFHLELTEVAEQAGVLRYAAEKEEKELAFYRNIPEELERLGIEGDVALIPQNALDKLGWVVDKATQEVTCYENCV